MPAQHGHRKSAPNQVAPLSTRDAPIAVLMAIFRIT
jgi:hypothetical protein